MPVANKQQFLTNLSVRLRMIQYNIQHFIEYVESLQTIPVDIPTQHKLKWLEFPLTGFCKLWDVYQSAQQSEDQKLPKNWLFAKHEQAIYNNSLLSSFFHYFPEQTSDKVLEEIFGFELLPDADGDPRGNIWKLSGQHFEITVDPWLIVKMCLVEDGQTVSDEIVLFVDSANDLEHVICNLINAYQ